MNEINLFTKIFIDTEEDKDTLLKMVQEMVDGSIEQWTISFKSGLIDLVQNDDFGNNNKVKVKSSSDQFLYFRYYLDIEPYDNNCSEVYIADISCLLESLWKKNINAVAACDFEDLLPKKGGYNYKNR